MNVKDDNMRLCLSRDECDMAMKVIGVTLSRSKHV